MKSKLLLAAVASVFSVVGAVLVQVAPTILEKVWEAPKKQTPLVLHWMRERKGSIPPRYEHVYQATNTTKLTISITAWWRGLDDLSVYDGGPSKPGPDPIRSRTFENQVSWSRITVAATSAYPWADAVFTVDGQSLEVLDVPQRLQKEEVYGLVKVGGKAKAARGSIAIWPN